ncbi:SAV_2336 N-terminal domain-related protein [Streptomyces sp. HF10]|uniref:SAV_2336 N-terminal domain-related protein n=1 Tax=Streptomyces sp. HF10 TaxID=2692233 RepID=UPI0013167731|nr:SAV_2336 N-terminal domain-related protein [Streptomyces sp. HF10]QHC29340.1 serine/threonine protein kinase [Streptomyces sp. HF10]
MSSDTPETPDALARLAAVLAEAAQGEPPTPRELAELLWLAGHMGAEDTADTADTAGDDRNVRNPEDSGDGDGDGGDRTTEPEPPPGPGPAHDPRPPERETHRPRPGTPSRVPLHLPSPSPALDRAPHTALTAPAPPMLRHPLALQRALRPLRRRVDAPVGQELDERATADRIARLGAAPDRWLPVLRPARERWLSLNLVYDAGPTMPVWRPLIDELHTALAQSGAFRTVALYRAAADGTVRGPDGQPPADGRTVTLLISDCMGPQWREGPAGTLWYATLHRWARRMPLAVVQPLPEHLWRESALPASPGRLSAPHPVAPSAALTFTPYDEPECDDEAGAVVLPVLEPEPRWLANWAGLISTPGGTRFPAAAARLTRPLPFDAQDRTDVGRLSAEELVLRFRATASPEAFRLAGHLAVGRPDLPVMRLVQAAVEPDPRPRHLAEVVLSGMLTALPGAPAGSYAFREGVRELLLLGLPRTERNRTVELLDRMGEFIDELAGRAPGGFRAVVPSSGGAPTPVERQPVAMLSEESVRRLAPAGGGGLLAGRYRLLRKSTAGVGGWVAEDVWDGGARVVVCRYAPGEYQEPFGTLCQHLAEVTHPGVARVLDHGFAEGKPYLVREFAEGPTLHERLADGSPDLPEAEVRELRLRLREAVLALHAVEGPRGELNARCVVLSPRGPVLTCLDAAPIVPGSRAEALRTVTELLANLAPEPLSTHPDTTRILFTTDDLTGRPETRISLEAAVHEILTRSLPPGRFQVRVRPDGYRVDVEPGTYLLPVLVAVLRELPFALPRPAERTRLRVAFGQRAVRLPESATGVDVLVPPALYDEFTASSAARDAPPFEPLYADDAPDAPPLAWYCPLTTGHPRRDLVQGPFITQDLRELGVPTPGRAAVVHTRADGPLTVLDPIRPYGGRAPRAETYYTVDLTVRQARHQLSLPSSGKTDFTASAELTWRVGDPVAFVRSGATGVAVLLLEHLRAAAAQITARHPVRRTGAAERAVNDGVRDWPVPGLAVTYTVRLGSWREPEPAPSPRSSVTSRRRAVDALMGAGHVLIGFDGPLTRLFAAHRARTAVLALLEVVAENRDPESALAGLPLSAATWSTARSPFPHPLDLLRAFARDPLGPLLRDRLEELELAAVPDAPMTHRSLALVRALHRSGRRVSVVSDVSSRAVQRGVQSYRLPLAGVHGRREDLGLLTPDPHCLLRALEHLGTPARTGVLLGSSVAELTAAQRLGLPFIGFAPATDARQLFHDAGAEAVVSTLEPLLEAVHAG